MKSCEQLMLPNLSFPFFVLSECELLVTDVFSINCRAISLYCRHHCLILQVFYQVIKPSH